MKLPARASALISTALAVVIAAPTGAVAATLQPQTVRAWEAYVAATEVRIARELSSPRGFLITDFLSEAGGTRTRVLAGQLAIDDMATTDRTGAELDVPGGRIAHWRGSVFLPGVALDQLLQRVQQPSERGPHQPDVLAVRVLDRQPQGLSLFIRMTRTKIVTVTYDTEHRLDYRRQGRTRASSRSIATRIAEIDDAGTSGERAKPPGEDRGFLWRMNSYWRYEQVTGGVIVELESLTLSRSVPMGLGPLVTPIINRIARESIANTLEQIRRTYAVPAQGRQRDAS
jgi:hypothetical protein